MLRYVFANTSNEEDVTTDTGYMLRKVAAMYAACKYKQLIENSGFRELLEEGGELVSTMGMYLSRRLVR